MNAATSQIAGRPGRLLHLIATLEGGGAERQLAYLTSELHRRGWDVTVAVLRMGANAAHLAESGVHVRKLKRPSTKDPRNLLEIAALIRQLRPDLVQTWLPYMDIVGGLAATRAKVPWIATERTDPASIPPHLRFRYRHRRILRKARAVVANSETAADHFRRRGLSGDAHFVANGLPLEEFDSVTPADRGRIGLLHSVPMALIAGRFIPEKGVRTFLTAMSQVQEVSPEIEAAIFGQGPLGEALRQHARELCIEDRVRFAGYVDDLPSWLKAADVVVSPSMVEGSPNVVLEAMACHAPLVLSDIQAHRTLADGVALFFPPGDAKALAACIEAVLQDPDAGAERAETAADRVAAFSVAAMTTKYEAIYRTLTGSGT